MMRHNSGLKHLKRTEHTKEETISSVTAAQTHIADLMLRREKDTVVGLYSDKYQMLSVLDNKLNELKTNFTHDAFERFVAEVIVCEASLLASYRCVICRDTLTVCDDSAAYYVDCECTRNVESFIKNTES